MLRLLRTLTPGLLALCHLGVAQAAVQTAPPDANPKQTNKAASSSSDETAAKKKITQKTYDTWKRIDSPLISDDGRWVTYTLVSGAGDAELVVRSVATTTEFKWIRSGFGVRCVAGRRYGPARIAGDGRFVVFTVDTAGVPCGSLPETGTQIGFLALMDLSNGQVTRLGTASTFSLSPSTRYLAYAPDNGTSRDKTLVLHDLSTGAVREITDVSYFLFDRTGNYLAYTSTSPQEEGAYVLDLRSQQVIPLLLGSGDFRGLTFDSQGEQLVFLYQDDDSRGHESGYAIYHVRTPKSAAKPVVTVSMLPAGMRISQTHITFTRNGKALTFSLVTNSHNQMRNDEARDKPTFELWHWRDPIIQSRKKFLVRRGEFGSQAAIYHIAEKRVVLLGNLSMSSVLLSADGKYAVGIDQSPYKVAETWGESVADIYILDVFSGKSRLMRRGLRSGEWFPSEPLRLSPSGRYLLYFEDRRWFSYDLTNGNVSDLTGALLPEIQFNEELGGGGNRPATPIGIGGWTKNDKRVLLYDRYDIWEVDPSNTETPRNITRGLGRRENIVFRIWREPDVPLDTVSNAEEFTFDADLPLLLTSYDEDSMVTGIWRSKVGSESVPENMLTLDKRVRLIARTGNTSNTSDPPQYLLTQETFQEFPDLWVGQQLNRLKRISDANPQQAEYLWGSVQVVSWKSDWGVPLQGLLYKPENFRSTKKYPMIVHIYSLFSYRFNTYQAPEPNSSAFLSSIASYLSRDYIVFMPDIRSAIPYPGESAVASILPGVESVIDRGFVDRHRIGLTGHSLGGYETLYMVTRTNLFRCAIASAGVANGISGYGAILGNGGSASSYLYERGYATYGNSIWQNPFVYLSNSPLIFADRIQTPLLLMYNDDDGIIPFAQGMEIYIALRRNNKEAYLLNYLGEDHNLARYSNRLDWDQRMMQYFEYFLKDGPKPAWMEHAVVFH